MPTDSPLELLFPAKDINERVDRLEKVLLYPETSEPSQGPPGPPGPPGPQGPPGPAVTQLPFVVLAEVTGKPGAGQVLTDFPLPVAMLFPAGFKDSQAAVSALPKSAAKFSIRKNGTEFGALTITQDGSLSWNSRETILAKGERISIVAPVSKDAALAGVSISLLGWMQLD